MIENSSGEAPINLVSTSHDQLTVAEAGVNHVYSLFLGQYQEKKTKIHLFVMNFGFFKFFIQTNVNVLLFIHGLNFYIINV
ncbi:hypothetical protein B0A58_05290 [Flavobacterium branchiophilum NBRC 15030 = ATCC 35035]|nr:hypothetical protein B0A58_05290 [Flavobacterium branchiophilum NBRC 15030 = ATCC 35035]GEM54210.1 hypothetical protein FB1_04310 [Flavobacterium branchiophilum NBRC 15030 = ATCC 35035]